MDVYVIRGAFSRPLCARQSRSKDSVKSTFALYLIMVYFVCEACNEVRRLRSLVTDSLVNYALLPVVDVLVDALSPKYVKAVHKVCKP